MNIFDLDIDHLDSREAAEAMRTVGYDRLPGVPSIMTRAECSTVTRVSLPTIERLISSNALVETEFMDEISGIIKSDLLAYIEANLLVRFPVL